MCGAWLRLHGAGSVLLPAHVAARIPRLPPRPPASVVAICSQRPYSASPVDGPSGVRG